MFFSIFQISAQESIIFNKDYVWSKDDKSVTIRFDLAVYKPGSYYNISLIATLNSKIVKAITTIGDIGNYIESGEGKQIIWDITADIGVLKLDDLLTVDVVAREVRSQAEIKSESKWKKIASWGGIALGSGIAGYGLITELKAKDDYNTYRDNRYEISQVFIDQGMTRDELYEDANSRHKIAQTLMIGGGVVLVTGAAILVHDKFFKSDNQNVTVLPIVLPQYTSYGVVKPHFDVMVCVKF